MYFETLVVGGGMAGMSCALRLKEAGRDVGIGTEHLGGRVYYDAELKNNFGAVFYMENYKWATKLLKDNGPMAVELGKLMLHTSKTKVFKATSLTMVKSLPQLLKFQKFMKKQFMPEFAAYKTDCETMPVSQAMEKHPSIKKYFFMKASEIIAQLGIEEIADNFVSKFAYACTGSRIDQLNALDFLNVVQGVVIPIHDFTFDADEFTKKLDGKVVKGSVVSVEKTANGWLAKDANGQEYACTYLVIATTGLAMQKLLGVDEIRQPTMLVSALVKGVPNAEIAKAPTHYYGDAFDVIAVGRKRDDIWSVFSRTPVDMGEFFDSYEIIKSVEWPEALFTYGDVIQKQDWDENLWVAGDLNGLGLEPAAISGVYAANRILGIA